MALEAAVRRTKLGSQRVRPRANTGAYDSALRRQPKRSQPFACSGTSGASGGPGWPQRGTRPPVVLASRARGPAARRVPATGLAPVRWQRGERLPDYGLPRRIQQPARVGEHVISKRPPPGHRPVLPIRRVAERRALQPHGVTRQLQDPARLIAVKRRADRVQHLQCSPTVAGEQPERGEERPGPAGVVTIEGASRLRLVPRVHGVVGDNRREPPEYRRGVLPPQLVEIQGRALAEPGRLEEGCIRQLPLYRRQHEAFPLPPPGSGVLRYPGPVVGGGRGEAPAGLLGPCCLHRAARENPERESRPLTLPRRHHVPHLPGKKDGSSGPRFNIWLSCQLMAYSSPGPDRSAKSPQRCNVSWPTAHAMSLLAAFPSIVTPTPPRPKV